jgi:hypothetical protein
MDTMTQAGRAASAARSSPPISLARRRRVPTCAFYWWRSVRPETKAMIAAITVPLA